VRVDHDNIIKR